ncbi:DUF5994 family protein [Streptomyces bullii]|uniref:DUF5994 family protein n=1 Tax=Streptomyces bullii TaxID=349910 RepID=A0ABW0UNU7_9ACTN
MTSAPTPASPPPAPSGVRLRLAAQQHADRTARRIDGAWWPWTYDLAAELPGLLGELPCAWGRISSVRVDGGGWTACPERMIVAGQPVRVRRTQSPKAFHALCLLAPGRGRWDLLVVPPGATEAEAGRLMERAVTQGT